MVAKRINKHVWKVHDILLIAGVIVFLALLFNKPNERELVADDLMVVNKIYIPNHYSWEDPVIVYDRTIFKKFNADWVVEVYPVGDKNLSCTGSGNHTYIPTDSVVGNTLSWFIGKMCNLKPGDYLARVRWTTPEGIAIDKSSNVFTVFESGKDVDRVSNDNR